eukprot:m.49706 g.49706  ORF g.49706 m.49706 type:complete len:462 (+) comp34018_c0_seq22:879-2264(+)
MPSYGIFFVCLFVALEGIIYVLNVEEDRSKLNTKAEGGADGAWRRDGSSVYCDGDSIDTRTCRFENLCYFPEHDEFAVLHGPRSVFSGLPGDFVAAERFRPLVDLSSVRDHNTQRLEIVDLPASALEGTDNRTVVYHRGLHFLFKRFNPGNLMHVLHDDLLPIYVAFRRERVNSEEMPFRLVAVDSHPVGPYTELYDAFSASPLVIMDDLRRDGRIACFEKAVAGMTKETTWYQYGFFQPQGPIDGMKATGRTVRQLAEFVRRRMNISASAKGIGVVLLSRSINRLILNENELAEAVAKEMNSLVTVVPVETPVREMIAHISNSSVLIGMHGGTISLALFLQPHSALIELFPYAIPAESYAPYRTLAGLSGMCLGYAAWENRQLDKTVVHPEHPAHYGGLGHLNESTRERILRSSRVPLHQCCSDPEWLFRAYQDTVVDVPSVLEAIRQAWTSAFDCSNLQ